MKGITYYKLRSPYMGDVTKNCSLDGFEVDQNFFNLEGRDIKCITIDGTNLVITLLNGETVHTSLKPTLETSYEFDERNGVLKITNNGETKEIGGFGSANMIEASVGAIAVDGTMVGNGKPNKPVGIAPTHKTGVYRPVKCLFDLTKGEKLPHHADVKPGDRFITFENQSDFGMLYNYEGVKRIACDLNNEHKGWRIPTKEDWDDMLNALELAEKDKNHGSAMSNKQLGCVAGKFLKSKKMWKCDDENRFHEGHNDINCQPHHMPCDTPFFGEVGHHHHHHNHHDVCDCGIDKFGFNVLPVGYADDMKQYQYFLERAWYWTATNQEYTNAYSKRFGFNTSKVYQDIVSTDFYLSLRLVKDYDGDNYLESEQILGSVYPTVLMPSAKKGKAIWTSVNIGLTHKDYKAIFPNDGLNILVSKKYFINEWDGKKWLRNEVSEGESVVIKDAPDAKKDMEYRVMNGVLVNTSFLVYKDVMHSIKPELNHLEEQIAQETHRSVVAERELKDAIDENLKHLVQHDEELVVVFDKLDNLNERVTENKDTIEATIEKLESEINDRINDVDEETKRAEIAEQQLQENLDNEIKERIADVDEEQSRAEDAEKLLQENIDNETKRAEAAERLLQDNIDEETKRAEIAEQQLQENLDNETKRAEAAEAQLQANIDKETEERKQKDVELENKIPTQEGTSFDSESGVLTIKSFGGTNDIQVQFTFNFGEI